MQILASSKGPSAGPFAVGIGVFDGVHVGHQALLAKVRTLAEQDGIDSLAYTFDPHPAKVVNPAGAPPLLEPVEIRLEHFAAFGMRATLLERFDREFSHTTAEQFVDEILIGKLNARHVVVGQGFRFGAGGKGNVALLEERAARVGCRVHAVEPVHIDGTRVSSTLIRKAVAEGDCRLATRLLGRPFALFGLVMRGAMRGKGLGFPTANLQPSNEVLPATGVYACTASTPTGRFQAVANIGSAPTFGANKLTVEAHLLDYDGGDLYGVPLTVQLFERLREERRFANVDELRAQIARDIETARQRLGTGA